jgi:hypothetical protein
LLQQALKCRLLKNKATFALAGAITPQSTAFNGEDPMDLGVKGLGNTQPIALQGQKPVAAPSEPVVSGEATAVAGAPDALALGARAETAVTSSRQLARDFAKKYTQLQAAALDPITYDQTVDALGTPEYVVVDAVNCLCRDTQGEPLEERMGALNMIQQMFPLPDEMRHAIEADLERTSAAA